jgi:hypothetical protein
MSVQWRNFNPEELAAIAADASRAESDLSERACPSCGEVCLRTYYERSLRRSTPVLLVQVWCGNCHKFTGSTGPMPEGLMFDDPLAELTEDQRRELGDVKVLFSTLDLMWSEGRLPQRPVVTR